MRGGRRLQPHAEHRATRGGMRRMRSRELPDGVRRLQEWDAYPVRASEALEELA